MEKSENTALVLSCGRRIHILSKMMTPLPHHSTSSLRPLNPTTSHNNNNNNGSGQHACASTAADIEPIRVTGAKYYAPLPRSPCTRHCCLLLVMFGFSSTVCLYRAKAFCASSVSSSPFSSRMVIELAHNSSENPVAQTADSQPSQTLQVESEQMLSTWFQKLPTQQNTRNRFVPERVSPNA